MHDHVVENRIRIILTMKHRRTLEKQSQCAETKPLNGIYILSSIIELRDAAILSTSN
jgi:hypothetical protein